MLNRSLNTFALLAPVDCFRLLTETNNTFQQVSSLQHNVRSQELYAQSQELLAAHAGDQQMIAGLQMEQQTLSQGLADSMNQLTTANERVENLLTERSELKDRYASAIETPYNDSFHTNYGVEIPGFEFDSVTGLYRFIAEPFSSTWEARSCVLKTIPILKDFVASAPITLRQTAIVF